MVRTLALLLVWLITLAGCETNQDISPAPELPTPVVADGAAADANAATRLLTDRVWTRSDLPELPGSMRVFLADGTLLIDSCWETYRIEAWTSEADSVVRWQEDGRDIRAAVVSLSDDGLMLRINGENQSYAVASTPYLCPDMPR